jgi:hypothetical protein
MAPLTCPWVSGTTSPVMHHQVNSTVPHGISEMAETRILPQKPPRSSKLHPPPRAPTAPQSQQLPLPRTRRPQQQKHPPLPGHLHPAQNLAPLSFHPPLSISQVVLQVVSLFPLVPQPQNKSQARQFCINSTLQLSTSVAWCLLRVKCPNRVWSRYIVEHGLSYISLGNKRTVLYGILSRFGILLRFASVFC